jgi:predicted ATP-dependent serine protease
VIFEEVVDRVRAGGARVVVFGMPGIGKSALATELAHQFTEVQLLFTLLAVCHCTLAVPPQRRCRLQRLGGYVHTPLMACRGAVHEHSSTLVFAASIGIVS